MDGKGRSWDPKKMDIEEIYNKFRAEADKFSGKQYHGAILAELKALMKVELQNVYDGYQIDENEENYEEAIKGYPSFMKSMSPEEFDKVADHNMSYSVMHGPAQWRETFEVALENLVEGRETQADLDKMNNILMSIYYKKKPKDAYEAMDHDNHMRMAKEIRRRQYDVQVREKSLSRSPARSRTKIVKSIPEKNRSGLTIGDLKNSGLRDYVSPNTEAPKANVVITDKGEWPKECDFSDIDPNKKHFIDDDPLKATHSGAGVPVRVQRAPNSEDPTEDDLYEELLNERWQRRVRAVKGKIKNFLTEDGMTKEMVEDCVDVSGRQFLRPIFGNLKRKNHPNIVPSVFLLMEE